ncbi:MAG: hypothetical protein PHT33_15155 [bacterium]|nr:hypothetical protein [bacterium]
MKQPNLTPIKRSIILRKWSQLGVAGAIQAKDNWIIDPEALLLFTMDAGRYDPRLFDEVADWTLRTDWPKVDFPILLPNRLS